MKKRFLLTGVTALLCLFTPKAMAQSYELRTLTFEDGAANVLSGDFSGESGDGAASVWSDLIDDPQYYGSKLYTDGATYWWHDGGNTELFHTCGLPYWGGGHVISHYGSNDLSTYGNSDMQLTVYKADEDYLAESGAGHNGSDNFAVHFGYAGYGSEQTLEFADGNEYVIDHMYVNNTTYLLNAWLNGSSFSSAAGSTDWFRIEATGYDANDDETNTIYFYLCRGNDITSGDIVTQWTKWEMEELGAVAKVVFSVQCNDELGTGNSFVIPAYFAYDDVAVRFPVSTPPAPTSYERDVTVGRYGTICLPYAVGANNRSGATFYNVVAQTSEGIILEEETGDLTAGQAYIFYATATSLSCTYSGEAVQTPVDASLNNGLQGTFEDNTVVPTGMCFLYNNLLWQSTGSNHVNANRAYLNMTYVPNYVPAPVPGRRRIVIGRVSEEATGVDAIEENGQNGRKEMINGVLYINRNGRMFNAQGQEVK